MPEVPTVAQWIEDPTLLQLWHRWQLQLRFSDSIPDPGTLICMGVAKKKKKKKKKRRGKVKENKCQNTEWPSRNGV